MSDYAAHFFKWNSGIIILFLEKTHFDAIAIFKTRGSFILKVYCMYCLL